MIDAARHVDDNVLWVTTKHGVSPQGPLSPHPPSPSVLPNDLRPITSVLAPSSISCRMASGLE
jgi:hypothetical protein